MGKRARLVIHHEHRVELRVETLVDEHLDRDAAVREERGRHARRHGRRAEYLGVLQPVDVHLAVGEEKEVAVPRVAYVERLRRRVRRGSEEERVAAVGARPR